MLSYPSSVNRITPAYAGKRKGSNQRDWSAEDHPRLCGEKKFPGFCMLIQLGSPPPMRGKVPTNLAAQLFDRITPAYAGKRAATTASQPPEGDHPRLCGEKKPKRHRSRRMPGSPPPMRGKAIQSIAQIHRTRITPAYAGKR